VLQEPNMTTRPSAENMPSSSPRPRLESVDILRGLVMVLMVVDHARDFFTNFGFDPTDLSRTTPGLFLTRWVTHFCAPVFAFLAGTGAYLSGARGKSRGEFASFLLTRGLWLVLLELTVVNFGLIFNPRPTTLYLLVFWSIGCSLIVLAGLIYLPTWLVGAIGVAMIAGHNLADGLRPETLGPLRPLLFILHQQGPIVGLPGPVLFVVYPLIPWIGVTAAGYAFGALLLLRPTERRQRLLTLGLGLSAAFFVLRWLNFYGDPRPWSPQASPLFSVFSFLNCQKYPPSLLFLLMTLGPAITLLACVEQARRPLGRMLVTLGRVPLFFFVAHFYVVHALAVVVAAVRGVSTGWLFPSAFPIFPPAESAFSLPVAYLVSAVVIALLYAPCRWLAELKRTNRSHWLSYF
jgi:uncharacterized membrane protein